MASKALLCQGIGIAYEEDGVYKISRCDENSLVCSFDKSDRRRIVCVKCEW